jgi:hypothetical protein
MYRRRLDLLWSFLTAMLLVAVVCWPTATATAKSSNALFGLAALIILALGWTADSGRDYR